jgi:sugar lactone lactonase YvrE
MKSIHVITSFALFVAAAGTASAQALPVSFKAGNVIVNNPDTSTLKEYSPDGTFIREFGFDSDLDQAEQIVFGPNGVAYVACYSPGKILMYDGNGAQIDEIVDADVSSARGLALSSRGIYATSYFADRIVELDFAGNKLRMFGNGTALQSPVGIAVGPSGHIFAGSIGEKVLHEFDADGGWLRAFGSGEQPHCTGLARGPDGLLWVGSYQDASIMRFDADGTKVSEVSFGANGVQFFSFGADGNLMMSNGFSISHFDANGDVQAGFGGGHSHSGTTVPFRFKAQLTGVIAETGEPARKINLKKNLALTYWPANGALSIQLELVQQADVTPQVLDVFELLKTTVMVFHGDESRATPTTKARTFVGNYVPPKTMDNGIGSVSVGMTGKVVNGLWRPTKGSGSFNFSRNGKTFRGSIKTKGLLNG